MWGSWASRSWGVLEWSGVEWSAEGFMSSTLHKDAENVKWCDWNGLMKTHKNFDIKATWFWVLFSFSSSSSSSSTLVLLWSFAGTVICCYCCCCCFREEGVLILSPPLLPLWASLFICCVFVVIFCFLHIFQFWNKFVILYEWCLKIASISMHTFPSSRTRFHFPMPNEILKKLYQILLHIRLVKKYFEYLNNSYSYAAE